MTQGVSTTSYEEDQEGREIQEKTSFLCRSTTISRSFFDAPSLALENDKAIKDYVEELIVTAEENEKKVIEEKISTADKDYIATLRKVILQAMDMFWVEHLEVMDYMRSSVNLRAYGQRDPLVEYKREGLQLFKTMEVAIGQEILKLIPQIQPSVNFFNAPIKLTETREDAGSLTAEAPKASESPRTPDGEKVGRNDPCFCGSGKKYKKCGELNTDEHQKWMSVKI